MFSSICAKTLLSPRSDIQSTTFTLSTTFSVATVGGEFQSRQVSITSNITCVLSETAVSFFEGGLLVVFAFRKLKEMCLAAGSTVRSEGIHPFCVKDSCIFGGFRWEYVSGEEGKREDSKGEGWI